MKRTGMYAGSGTEMELVADRLLSDLCFIDERDADYERERSRLLSSYGKEGVTGPFNALFGTRRCQAEVAGEISTPRYFTGSGTSPSATRWARSCGRR